MKQQNVVYFPPGKWRTDTTTVQRDNRIRILDREGERILPVPNPSIKPNAK